MSKGRLNTLKPRIQPLKDDRFKQVSADSWRSGLNSTQRGYGYKWQQARAGYLAKHPLCVHCQAAGRVEEATEVDHVIPHRGDMTLFWDQTNWQGLCKSCHSGKTATED